MKKTIAILATLALVLTTVHVLAGSSGIDKGDLVPKQMQGVITALDTVMATSSTLDATKVSGALSPTTVTATGTITAPKVTGATAAAEVLSSGYSTVTTTSTLTDGGSYFITEGAAMVLTLPDPATMLGESIRMVLVATSGGVTVNAHSNNTYFVAGDNDATDGSFLLDTALDTIEIQAISTILWGVLDQSATHAFTTL